MPVQFADGNGKPTCNTPHASVGRGARLPGMTSLITMIATRPSLLARDGAPTCEDDCVYCSGPETD